MKRPKRSMAASPEGDRQFEVLARFSPVGIFRADGRGHFAFVNERCCEISGLSAEKALGEGWTRALHPEDSEQVVREWRQAVDEKRPFSLEFRFQRPGGEVAWVIGRAVPETGPVRAASGFLGTITDITDRKRAEEELQRTTERLQIVSRRVLEVQESERRRLARELHDEIGQALTAINFNLHALGTPDLPETMRKRLEDSQDLVEGALRQVRNLSLDLRPTMLDDFGLFAALQWYVDQQAQRTGKRMVFQAGYLDARPDARVETACFRVVQEALTNVVRHSGAQEVIVELMTEDGELHLVIRDDGAGFDPESVRRRRRRGAGFGLLGMEERVILSGGRFSCASAPGKGTIIRAEFPLPGPFPP